MTDSAADTIKIAYIGPLSGPSAVLGMDVAPALEIAVAEVNSQGGIDGRKVELIIEDDQYHTSNTVTAYQKVVHADGAKIVLVSSYGGLLSLADTAQQDGVILIDVLDCNRQITALNENVFCLATETESIGRALADYGGDEGYQNVAILYTSRDSFMGIVKDAFNERAVALGISTEELHYMDTERDFKTHLAKALESEPDAILLLGHDEIGIAMRQARNLGFEGEFLATGVVTSPSLQEASQGTSDGVVFAYWKASESNQLAKDFEEKFVERVGRPPILPLTTHPAYDTMRILLDDAIPGADGIDQVKQQLYGVQERQGTTGDISIGPDGGHFIRESVFRLVDGAPVAE